MAKKNTQDTQELEQDAAGVASPSGEQVPLETVVGQGPEAGSSGIEEQGGEQPPDATEQPVVSTDDAPPGVPDPELPVVMVECAVLLDCIYGKHDDIITLTESEAKSAQAGGYVDTHPNAIKAIRGH